MTVQYSTAVRNAQADAWEAAMGTAVKLSLWSGSMPANCAAAATGTKLIEWTLASDYSANASGGVKTLSSTPISANGLAGASTGTNAGYYRIYDSAGTTCHEQGTVTVTGGGGDATMDNISVANGQQINLASWSKTMPGA